MWGTLAVAVLVATAGSAVGAAPASNAHLPVGLSSAGGYRVGSWPKSVVVGDFTGDGLQDAVLGTGWSDDPLNDNKLADTVGNADPSVPAHDQRQELSCLRGGDGDGRGRRRR